MDQLPSVVLAAGASHLQLIHVGANSRAEASNWLQSGNY